MKVKIYRGTKEIGGTCVELKADNGKILWVDLGAPLDDKNPNVDYALNKVDALLISHPHQDHFGLMEKVGTDVPIFIGELSLDLINATKIFRGIETLNGNFTTFKPWKNFTIANTFQITPYLTDHSTPEAFAFLIEADGKRIFYSGDFRATGRKEKVYRNIIESPPKNIDLLLMEGTMVERTNHLYNTEDSVEEAIYKTIKEQKNLSFVISSAQNIDRLVSVFRACKRTKKYLVIDVYTAWILEMVRKQSKNIPAIEWEEIKVYDHPSQLEKIKDKSFDVFRNRIIQQRTGNSVFSNPSDYVYFVRCPNEKLVNKLRSKGTINIIYSQWEGYLLEEHKNFCTDNINALKKASDIKFQSIHTSGHATVPDLKKFAKAINAKMIVPIHTAYPKKFKTEFEKEGFTNINLWEDGKEYKLRNNINKSIFKRGIENSDFIKELNKSIHFQKMVSDKDLFIAIRKEYINVYYYGQSICKIEFNKREKKIKWTTHKKYLGINESGYAVIGDYLNRIDELKSNAKKHKGKEKEQVKKHILGDTGLCILDVEITFGREQGYETRSIDYVAVEKINDNRTKLVFYEAKHFDNNEIRANENPKIFEQIEKYEKALNDPIHKEEILNSYKLIYENIKELNFNNKNNLVQLIGENSKNLEIDIEPRIIIFEVDSKNKKDIHLEKLQKKFGAERLKLIYK